VLAAQLLFGPLANAALRYYAAATDRRQLGEFWAALALLTALASAAGVAIGLVALTAAGTVGFRIPLLVAGCAIVFAVLSGWEVVFDAVQSAQRQRWSVAWHQGLRQLMRPALAGAFITAAHANEVALAFAGYAAAAGLVLASQIVMARRQVRLAVCATTPDYVWRLLNYGLPFAGWGLFTWVQLSSDRWALDAIAGPAAVGRYAIIVQLGAQPLILLGAATAQLFEPLVYARAGSGADAQLIRSAFRMNGLVLAGCGAAMLLVVLIEYLGHALIFSIVVAPEYQDVSAMLPLAGLSGGLYSLGQLFAMGSVVLGGSRILLLPKIGSALAGTALNVVGAYSYGLVGVLAASVLTGVLYLLWVALIAIKRYRELAR
jgi:O-antigen/teichoic acid export membrane protein